MVLIPVKRGKTQPFSDHHDAVAHSMACARGSMAEGYGLVHYGAVMFYMHKCMAETTHLYSAKAGQQSKHVVQAFIAHPHKPSQARCDELAEPWHDSYTPQAPERSAQHTGS